jgi:hypothetical protein
MRQINDKILTGKDGRKHRNVIISWSDVKDRVMGMLERGDQWDSQPAMDWTLQAMHRSPYQKTWNTGDNYAPAHLLGWLREGFRAPEFANSAEYVPSALQHRATWSEEDGDIDIGRLYGGHDEFMLGMAERETKPGVRVQIEFAFACGVEGKCIAEYGAWVAGLLGAMEQYGFDMVVDVWIPLDSLYQGDRATRSNVLVRVKQANEVSDFTEWSAIFSPAGYRTLGFSAKCVAGDKIGKTAVSNLGTTIGGKTWGLEYDKDESVVRITVNQRAYAGEAFPAAKLTKQAIEAGLIPDPDAMK